MGKKKKTSRGKALLVMWQEYKNGPVRITPLGRQEIIIRNEEQAEMFAKHLRAFFKTPAPKTMDKRLYRLIHAKFGGEKR